MLDEFGSGRWQLASYWRWCGRDRLLLRRATGQKQATHQPSSTHALYFASPRPACPYQSWLHDLKNPADELWSRRDSFRRFCRCDDAVYLEPYEVAPVRNPRIQQGLVTGFHQLMAPFKVRRSSCRGTQRMPRKSRAKVVTRHPYFPNTPRTLRSFTTRPPKALASQLTKTWRFIS